MESNLCYGCMKHKPGNEETCPYCGYVNGIPREYSYLEEGTVIGDRYVIGKLLGHGGFGITYLGLDRRLDMTVAIKEYLPGEMATRSQGDKNVIVYTGEKKEQYDYGLGRFLDEAQLLAKYNTHPCIVCALDFFKENNTAYLIMEYIEGIPANDYVDRKGGKISFQQAVQIMIPVMDALREVHSQGIIHRDVSPDNIFITKDKQVKLLDFGAARHALGEKEKSLSVVLKRGYAPVEQYSRNGKQGPWTDVYCVAATIYRMITGINPEESIDRIIEDNIIKPSNFCADITQDKEVVLLKALAIKVEDRYQRIEDLQHHLLLQKAMPKQPVKQQSVSVQQPIKNQSMSVQRPAEQQPMKVQQPIQQQPIQQQPIQQQPVQQQPMRQDRNMVAPVSQMSAEPVRVNKQVAVSYNYGNKDNTSINENASEKKYKKVIWMLSSIAAVVVIALIVTLVLIVPNSQNQSEPSYVVSSRDESEDDDVMEEKKDIGDDSDIEVDRGSESEIVLKDDEPDEPNQPEQPEQPAVVEEIPKDYSEPLVIWTYTDLIKSAINDWYIPSHSDLPYDIEVVVMESQDYQQHLILALAAGEGIPDIITLETSWMNVYIESDKLLDLSTVGLEKEAEKNLYTYSLDIARDEKGELKALSFDSNPGAFFYKRSLAEMYLGESDPEYVQALMSDFDGFYETAAIIDTSSGGGCSIISSFEEMMKVFNGARDSGWIENNRLIIDPTTEEIFVTAKKLADIGTANRGSIWSSEWFDDMATDNVFGYFLPTWGLEYVLKPNATNDVGESTDGDWAMIQGPAPYYWGGSLLAISNESNMAQEATDILHYLTLDSEFLVPYAAESGSFLSNKTVVDQIKGNYAMDFLDGQNHYATFAEIAESINGTLSTDADSQIESLLNNEVEAYAKGLKDYNTCIADFKTAVQAEYPNLDVE